VKLLHKAVQRGPLQIASTAGGAVVFKGVIREPDPASWFGPLIDELHASAVRLELATVEVDLRALEYANAAAWKFFVYWLRRIADDHARYELHFLCEAAYRWQEVGMSTLRVFGGERVRVTTYRGEHLV
jgi:hypothetical protein